MQWISHLISLTSNSRGKNSTPDPSESRHIHTGTCHLLETSWWGSVAGHPTDDAHGSSHSTYQMIFEDIFHHRCQLQKKTYYLLAGERR